MPRVRRFPQLDRCARRGGELAAHRGRYQRVARALDDQDRRLDRADAGQAVIVITQQKARGQQRIMQPGEGQQARVGRFQDHGGHRARLFRGQPDRQPGAQGFSP
jgi:uncharacterized membrane protein YccC